MYRIVQFGIMLGVSLLILQGGGTVWAQAVDYNLNTQMIDLRSTGNASGGTGSDLNPGFNPCAGGTRTAAGTCDGGTGLLKPSNLNTLFPSLGPGAVTDNMFGLITAATVGSCATTGTGGTAVTLSDPSGLVSGLNCGDLHIDAASQGVVIPAANNTTTPINDLTAAFTTNTPFTANFSANPNCGTASDCTVSSGDLQTPGHAAFELTNTFTWTPTSSSSADVTGTQTMHQVTALNATSPNTIGGPTPAGSTTPPVGTGDQEVKVTTTFTNSSDANGGFSSPTVQWTSFIKDPDMSGSGPGFTQDISGSFVYNVPTTTFGCPESASTQGCSQYPSGSTQTQRSQGVTPTNSESLP
jgi:hypothetical protein